MRQEGQSYNYNSPKWQGTGNSCSITENSIQTSCYFVVRAFVGNDVSGDSNEVKFIPPPPNQAPTADAGADQAVDEKTTLTLDGSGSFDPDGSIVSYHWSQLSGPSTAISGSSAVRPSCSAPEVSEPTTLVFELTVTDAGGLTSVDTCEVTVNPVVDPDLDSDKDGLTDVNETNLYGTDPYDVDSDGDGFSDGHEVVSGTDPKDAGSAPNVVSMWIEAEDGNITSPMAIAGNAQASDESCIWVPSGSGTYTTSPSSSTGRAVYTFDVAEAGSYVIWGRVIANDGASDSLYVSVDGQPHMVWHTIQGGQDTWGWDVLTERLYSDVRDTSNPMIYQLGAGPHTVEFKHRESGVMLDRILITNNLNYVPVGSGAPPNQAPTADAGADQAVDEKTTLTLDGGGSFDPDGSIVSYHWSQLSGPSTAISGSSAVRPSCSAPDVSEPTTLVFELTVTDAGGLTSVDTCNVTVNPVVDPDLDSDNDGLTDVNEANLYGTDPYDADSDGDGFSDGHEVASGTDPKDAGSVPRVVSMWIEAEDGNITSPMAIAGNAQASGESCIWVPSGSGTYTTSPSSSTGRAVYTFDVAEAGSYVIWGRVIANDGASDSLYVSVDGRPHMVWHTIQGGQDTWVWDVLTERLYSDVRDTSNPMIYQLGAGPHTVEFKHRESGVMLDRILITNNLNYIPEGTGAEVLPSIWIEAEDGDIFSPMAINNSAQASGESCIWVPSGSGTYTTSPSSSTGRAVYTFDVAEAGSYVIWGRVIANDGASDSLYVSVDGQPHMVWHTIQGGQDTWVWDVLTERLYSDVRDTSNPMIYQLGAGPHTIEFKHRESGIMLDQLIVTKDLAFIPQP